MKNRDLSGYIDGLDQLPTLPAVAIRLIETTADDDAGLREVARLVEADQSLSAKLLKIANSSLFDRSGQITTVDQAAVLLGKDLVRSVVLSTSVFDTIRPVNGKRFNLRGFWNHSLACAIASEILAQRLNYPRPMDAFVAGLLHDMGKLVLASWDAEKYDSVVAEATETASRLLECEEAGFGLGHTGVAKLAMERWRFPKDLIESAWLHHQPLSSFGDRPATRLPFLVKAANSLCHIFRIGDSGDPVERWSLDRLSMATAIPSDGLRTISNDVLHRFDDVASSFDWEADTADLYLSAVARANRELSEIQLRLMARNRRSQKQEDVLEAIHCLDEALDGAGGLSQGLIETVSCLDRFLDSRRTMTYVVQERSNCLEGCLRSGVGQSPIGFSCPLPKGAVEEFSALTPRAQVSFLQRAVSESPPFERNESVTEMLSSSDLLVFPLETRNACIGQILAVVDPGIEDYRETVALARRFARTAATALHRLLLNDDLQIQAEKLVRAARKVEETERRLFHSERLASVGRLAAGAAHEINNPLTVISGHVELLMHDSSDERSVGRLQQVLQQIDRISEITGNLMGLARPAEPQIESIRLQPILERTLSLLQRRAHLANIEVRRRFDSEGAVLGDPKQLEQVFLNICINAVQAMEEKGGRLSVSLRPSGDEKEVQVDIGDTGKGIDPDHLPSIFDPFFTTKPEGQGTGLGLAICLSIVRNHGGRVLVSSKPGRGSTFRIMLPVADSSPALQMDDSESLEAETPKRSLQADVLAVDDESAIRDLLGQALSEHDLGIDFAEDGVEALQKLRRKRYDLVLLDLRMPKKAGIEVLHAIARRTPDLPVVVVSGVAHPNEFEEARAAGAFDCLKKPFKIKALMEVVQRALEARSEESDWDMREVS